MIEFLGQVETVIKKLDKLKKGKNTEEISRSMCAAELSSLCGVRTIILTLLTMSLSACVIYLTIVLGELTLSIKFPKPVHPS